jgi:CheY-like chemotaxis protein
VRSDGMTIPFDNPLMEDCERLNLKDLKVLVVDDEPDARDMVAAVLADCGVKATRAGSAAEAMQALYEGRFDILLSDIGMPGDDGYSLIRQVREFEARRNRPKMPAVALTAYARTIDRRQIMLAGFQVHVAKPVEPGELLAVIASLTDRIPNPD